MNPRVSIVVPVHNEGENVRKHLVRLLEQVSTPCEVVVVFDSETDSTVPVLTDMSMTWSQIKPTLNTHGRGPASAIRTGMEASLADVVVVTMADGCDDASQIDVLYRLVERGVAIACASRYVRGGQQIGGPLLKGFLSRLAGLSLFWLARVGTHDATNSFKAYSKEFLKVVGVESGKGFEIGIELVAKARRARLPVAEIPTIWLDRTDGVSSFKIIAWIGAYLRWYVYAFGPKTKSKTDNDKVNR